jgi:drug/metabolite transporter (DMT)-like permease
MQKIWHGVFWKIVSCGCFAGINVLVRFLSGGSPIPIVTPLPIYSIMFFQNIIGVIVISSWLWQSKNINTQHLRTSKPWLHLLRIVTAAIGIALWYISLRCMPITQVVALSLIGPIITTVGAIVFLKEQFNLQRKIAVFLSIAGGFLIARPDRALSHTVGYNWYMLLPLLAAFVFALEKLLTRKLLALQESPSSLAWSLLAFISPLCLLPVFFYGWVSPDMSHLPWILLLGILNALAHYTFNKAYALAEVTMLLPFGGTKLILSAGLSYLAFFEIPKSFDMWLGITVIALSTLVLGMSASFINRMRLYFSFNQEVRN